MKWAQMKSPGRRVWHAVKGVEHWRQEYPNGGVDEGEEVQTLCHPHGYAFVESMDVIEQDAAPGKVCVACTNRLGQKPKHPR